MLQTILLGIVIALHPLDLPVPGGSEPRGAQSIRASNQGKNAGAPQKQKAQKKQNPQKQNAQKKQNTQKKQGKKKQHNKNQVQTKKLKLITTGAGFANEITLEDRVNDRLSQMQAQSGDLTAAQNFEEQKQHRIDSYIRIEQERKAILRALEDGSLRAERINALDGDGFNVLHHVVKSGWTDIAEKLLRAGEDPDVKDVTGRSAREWAHLLNNPGMAALLDRQKPAGKK